jgi:hypothetical protein
MCFRTTLSHKWTCRYFQSVLLGVSSGSFYNSYVQLPSATTPLSDYISKNTKFFPFFQNALGALDGTHINCSTTATDWHTLCDCKGGLTQNCLAVCGFDFCFLYFISRFEGSAAGATMCMHAQLIDFVIPQGQVLYCWCWFCTLQHTLGSLPRCMLSSSRMGKGRQKLCKS